MAARYWTVTWEALHRDAHVLAALLAGDGPYRGIVAISRGGLIPAALLAHALGLRVVETVCVVTYDPRSSGDEETPGDPIVTKPPLGAGDGEGFLIVDDLVDTGTTARVARALLPKARFACVYAKPAGRPLADAVAREVDQDTWIVLPWEREPGDGG